MNIIIYNVFTKSNHDDDISQQFTFIFHHFTIFLSYNQNLFTYICYDINNRIEGEIMNDLLERYLGAVCAYFFGPKKKIVYDSLKLQIQSSVNQYDDLEDLLVNYGHPRSIALTYGYRPIIYHIYNHKIVTLIEKHYFIFSMIYLFLSTIYYLSQLNCLPFSFEHLHLPLITWILSYPFIVMGSITIMFFLMLLILDKKNPAYQEYNLHWSLKELYALPHQSHYPNHLAETVFMLLFAIFFISYTIFFSNDIIMQIQHESYQMIHLMTYFFQPFIMIIIVDYIIDLTKKIYTKKYIMYSSLINILTIIALSLFVFNSSFLKDYLLPFAVNINYTMVNVFIIGALLVIYFISIYKLARNLKSYRSLFRK